MMHRLGESIEIITAVYLKSFKLKDDISDADILNMPQIPKHFANGGIFIAIKHMHTDGDLYRVFFNKITGNTTKKSFFRESMNSEIAGLLLDPNGQEGSAWDIEMEEFTFLQMDEYNVSEKVMAVIADIIAMPMDEFKKLSGEEDQGIAVDTINILEEPEKTAPSVKDPKSINIPGYGVNNERLYALDAAILEMQSYILSTIGGKYDNSGIDTKDLIYSDKHGKSINIFNSMKYLSRYLNDGVDKSNNPNDLLKAVHYIIFELSRRIILNQRKNNDTTK